MKTKKYFGDTVHEALCRARQDLGDDAILLESREIVGKGSLFGKKKLVEITAGIDAGNGEGGRLQFDPTVMMNAPRLPKNGDKKGFSDVLLGMNSKSQERSTQEPMILGEISAVRQELSHLNRRLQRLKGPDFPQPFQDVRTQLIEAGVSSEQSTMFVWRAYLQLGKNCTASFNTVATVVSDEMQRSIEQHFLCDEQRNQAKRTVVLMGPTGVGKTMTIMKLAAHPDIFGKKATAIVSTDVYRPAAIEPLKSFSRISGMPVEEIRNSGEIKKVLKSLDDKEVILVDTPGRSPYFPNYVVELQGYLQALNPTDVLLVLSMTMGLEDLFLASGLYLTLNPTGFVFTKFDETACPGRIFSILREVKLPVAYTTQGQSIPSDIIRGNSELICERIMTAGWMRNSER